VSQDPRPAPAEREAYETSDARLRPLLYFLAGLAVVIVLGLAISAWLERAFAHPPAEPDPMAAYRLPTKGPRLLASPGAQARSSAEEEAARLSTYGWIDRESGIVHVPIDVAIEHVLARGLPVRTQQAPAPSSPKTSEPPAADGSGGDGR